MGKLIGYARVSTKQQATDRQGVHFLVAGVCRDDLYVDHGVSGARASRPEFDPAQVAIQAGHNEIPVRGMLCFVDADWPLVGGHFTTQGVQVLWPKKASQLIVRSGDLEADAVDRIFRSLASKLLPA